ncbi:MAG: aminotransferase class V-fold PLP-dependent enzyme [Bryobacteraceae bacterium]
MKTSRRAFLGAATVAAASASPRPAFDFAKLREEFPWVHTETFFNPAGWHPMPLRTKRAMERYLEFKIKGPGEGREEWASGHQDQARQLFAKLINAKPSEISFVQSTLMGENVIVNGLGIPGGKWSVVTDELHYEGSLYLYGSLQKNAGLDLRIVKHRDGRIDVRDVEKAVDNRTRLIATSLVSYQNGNRPDIQALAGLAHAHKAYLYADVIQGAGAVPIDVRALDLDFCACSGYKWLMGDRGLGYLYVRESLQGGVVKQMQYGDRQFADFQYHMFPHDPPGPRPASWKKNSGAGSFYEVGNIANIVAAGHAESLKLIHEIGVDRIQAYVKPLVDKLRKELPRLGYASFTPPEAPTPTSAFVVAKPDILAAKLKKANVAAKIQWNQMRVSCSFYHTPQDVDLLLNAAS